MTFAINERPLSSRPWSKETFPSDEREVPGFCFHLSEGPENNLTRTSVKCCGNPVPECQVTWHSVCTYVCNGEQEENCNNRPSVTNNTTTGNEDKAIFFGK